MKHASSIRKIKTLGFFIIFILLSATVSAQKSIAYLIIDGFNQASTGLADLLKQTYTDIGLVKLNEDTVKSYEGIDRVIFSSVKNHRAILADGKLYTLHRMDIYGKSILVGDKTWDEVKDYLRTSAQSQADFFDKTFSASMSHTQIFEYYPTDGKGESWTKPRYKIFFYPKKLTLPEDTNRDNIEEKLDAISYFSIEVYKQPFSNNYFMKYRVSGGTPE